MRTFALVLFVVGLPLLAACDGGERLTLSQYNRWCARLDIDDFGGPRDATWGDVADALERMLDEMRSIRAPDELDDYHKGTIKMIDEMAKGPRTYPRHERLDQADREDMLYTISANQYILERTYPVPRSVRAQVPACFPD